MQSFWLDIPACMDGNNDTGFVRSAVKDDMAALLTVEFKPQFFGYTNQVLGFDLRKKRTHAATWMGLIITSSEGTGSEWAIFNYMCFIAPCGD